MKKRKYITQELPETAVETQAEKEIVVDRGLIKHLEKWAKAREIVNKSEEAADQKWIQLAKYVREHEISKEQLFYVLIKIRGVNERSARSEVVRLMRFQTSEEASDMLDRKLNGDDEITVHDLRSPYVKRGKKGRGKK